jgi:hypothetical protein
VALAGLFGCSTSSEGHGSNGRGGAGGVASGGSSCTDASGGAAPSCPRTSLPENNRFCVTSECFGPDDVNCDVGCQTQARATCFGTCSTGEKAFAQCHDGNWTCFAGGKVVGTCCTDSCLGPSCCFPTPCTKIGAHDVEVSVGVGPATGAGGAGGAGGAPPAFGSESCDGHTFDARCDADGYCACTLDGHMVGTCKDARDIESAADPTAGCCGAYFTGC